MNSEPILEVRHLNVWYRPSGVLRRGRQQVGSLHGRLGAGGRR